MNEIACEREISYLVIDIETRILRRNYFILNEKDRHRIAWLALTKIWIQHNIDIESNQRKLSCQEDTFNFVTKGLRGQYIRVTSDTEWNISGKDAYLKKKTLNLYF